jgi:osmoprotectant transport system ATP-binding protein
VISLQAVSKAYGADQFAVRDLSLDINEGELCALLGPSGCGKTTTLKMINRLIEPTSGRLLVGGEDVTKTDPVQLRRRIGYVMQQGGLFPHQKVADNIAVVPKLLGWSKEKIRSRVHDLLELVSLDPSRYASRYPHELSGGERQRVGVARALGGDPPVLLMDEPFGAVDPLTRKRLQDEFAELQATLRKTVVFVTHDIDEAVRLGTRIALLRTGGILEQHATPAELLSHPASSFVADFLGTDQSLERLDVISVKLQDLLPAPALSEADPVNEAIDAMAQREVGFAIVIDDLGAPIGWFSLAVAREHANERVGAISRPLERSIGLKSSLRAAFAEMLHRDEGFVAINDDGRYVGALTPEYLHAAMRRSVGGEPESLTHG